MTADRTLETRDITLGYDAEPIIAGLTTRIPPGRTTVIVGANACGKSTLLRGLARLLPARAGGVLLDGTDLRALRGREVARVLGLLPQGPVAPDAITVGDLVGRGRYPHQGWFRRWTAADDAAVQSALDATGTSDLIDRPVAELSGGQRQRVWIALALAQQTDVLLLDEPTTFLDINYQVEVLDLLHDLNRDRGTTVVMVLHELHLAARYADHLIAMRAGRIVAEGAPVDILTADLVREVFALESEVILDPRSGTPLVIPLGRNRLRPADPASSPAG